ncbi:alpha/beta fold hydrolase [soil metagenome]
MLFLHGIPTNHLLWTDVIAGLDPGVRALAPDLTGFGLSDLPPDADLSPAGQARDLLDLLDHLEANRFTIVAHDYGALVAFELLGRIPERIRGLVVANTSIRPGDWSGTWYSPFRVLRLPVVGEVGFKLARRWMLRLAFKPFVAEWDRFGDARLDAFWEPFERGFDRTLLRLFRSERMDLDATERWRRILTDYDGPLTLVWGVRDPAFRIDRAHDIARLAPRSTLIELVRTNHFVPIDNPRVLARVIGRQIAGEGR